MESSEMSAGASGVGGGSALEVLHLGDCIHHHDKHAQGNLHGTCQRARINDGHQVVLDEPALEASLARLPTE